MLIHSLRLGFGPRSCMSKHLVSGVDHRLWSNTVLWAQRQPLRHVSHPAGVAVPLKKSSQVADRGALVTTNHKNHHHYHHHHNQLEYHHSVQE